MAKSVDPGQTPQDLFVFNLGISIKRGKYKKNNHILSIGNALVQRVKIEDSTQF